MVFTGFVDSGDSFAFLRSMDVECFPSRVEGLHLSVLDAMSTGCPMVAFDNTGMDEAVKGFGILVKTGDEDALFMVMFNMCRDNRKRYEIIEKVNSLSRVLSSEVMTENILNIFSEKQ